LTEPRAVEIVTLAVTEHGHATVHFRATSANGNSRDVIDTLTFDDQARITSMQAYAI
jgi:steroid delta-isomerase